MRRILPRTLAPALVAALSASMTGAGPALAQSSPAEDDADPVSPAAAEAPAPRAAGKPVPFDRDWLEPFFKKGPGKQAVEHFRAEAWAAAEAGFAKAVRALPRKSDEHHAASYLLALARSYRSKCAEGGKDFEELFARYSRLAPYHAYHAARCRLRQGDAAGALEWAGRVPRGTVPEAEAELIRIDALRTLGRWDDVLAATDAYLQRFPNGPRIAEALFRKAEALENAPPRGSAGADARPAPPDATALYRRVWASAPLEAWSERAAQRLEQIAATRSAAEAAILRTRTASELVTRGTVYFDRNRNTESETTFAAALTAPGLDADLECRARFFRAQSVWKQRQRSRAAPLFDEAEKACAKAGNADLHTKSLYQGGRCYANIGDRAGATARYARVEAEHADHSYADDARVRAAELATDAGDEQTAAKLLAEVPTRYPKGDLLNEALWRLAFAAWRGERFEEALRWLDENLRLIPREQIWYAEGRALYWKARVYERQGNEKKAREFYEKAVREYPLSVYALLGLTRLRALDPAAEKTLVANLRKGMRKVPAWSFPKRSLYTEPGFLRAVDLARMGQGNDARRELTKLGLTTSADKHRGAGPGATEEEDLLWITAILLDRGGVWNASHSLPRYGVTRYRLEYPEGLGVAKWKLSYPRAFPNIVSKNAKANQLPDALQLAIMREESAFSPRIESFANAIGLTQMLVKTAKRFANGANVTREVLFDPARNVELGARFLGFLYKRFDGAAPLTIASYNAGEGAVERWLGERGALAMDEFMETIPYDETRNYTKRVLASFFTYAWLYGDKPVPKIPLAAKGSPSKPSRAQIGAVATPRAGRTKRK